MCAEEEDEMWESSRMGRRGRGVPQTRDNPPHDSIVCTTSERDTGGPHSLPNAGPEKDRGLADEGGQRQRLGAVSSIEHKDPVHASNTTEILRQERQKGRHL